MEANCRPINEDLLIKSMDNRENDSRNDDRIDWYPFFRARIIEQEPIARRGSVGLALLQPVAKVIATLRLMALRSRRLSHRIVHTACDLEKRKEGFGFDGPWRSRKSDTPLSIIAPSGHRADLKKVVGATSTRRAASSLSPILPLFIIFFSFFLVFSSRVHVYTAGTPTRTARIEGPRRKVLHRLRY